jgi:hypothetical protein
VTPIDSPQRREERKEWNQNTENSEYALAARMVMTPIFRGPVSTRQTCLQTQAIVTVNFEINDFFAFFAPLR